MNKELQSENIINQQRCMLNRYGVFFTITFDEIFNKEVYFKIRYGRSKNNIINELSLTLKDLRKMEINMWSFPNIFMVFSNDEKSITKALLGLRYWINKVLETDNGNRLFNKLTDNYKRNTWI